MTNGLKSGNRLRIDLSANSRKIDIPNLIQLQKRSFEFFLYGDKNGATKKKRASGIDRAFESIFPIHDIKNGVTLEYHGYSFKDPKYTIRECLEKGLSYCVNLKLKIRLILWELVDDGDGNHKRDIKDIKEQDIFVRDMPLMTDRVSFIVNGVERVVVNQLHRSPGVIFKEGEESVASAGKLAYNAQIIPDRGNWLHFECDAKDNIFIRINRRRKIPITIFFRALGYDKSEILKIFSPILEITIKKDKLSSPFTKSNFVGDLKADLYDSDGKLVASKDSSIDRDKFVRIKRGGLKNVFLQREFLVGKVLAYPIYDSQTGEILYDTLTKLDNVKIDKIFSHNISKIKLVNAGVSNYADYIIHSFENDKDQMNLLRKSESGDNNDVTLAKIKIYKVMRTGEPVTKEIAENFFDSLFFNIERYDLTEVGRMKMNHKLDTNVPSYVTVLTKEDIIRTVKHLIKIKSGNALTDDRDHLGNRRIRAIGELLSNEIHSALVKMQKIIKDKILTFSKGTEELLPASIINTKIITNYVLEFFTSGQLSQFMDQTNPLSEITHKRRLSTLGEGGIEKERAGFEVRDVHPTHYGRICPIETPEGQNIGLINTLALYAKVNDLGFIESPYRVVKKARVTDEIVYLTATQEEGKVIAPDSTIIDKSGNIVEDFIEVRVDNEIKLEDKSKVSLIDLSSVMVVGITASLIPFLEHNDANRALMGSNMQRQAVPLLKNETPLVGTGIEKVVAKDAWENVKAKRGGVVEKVDSKSIYIFGSNEDGPYIDHYILDKNLRTNQNTTFSQTPTVKKDQKILKGQIIADGPSMDNGELALGKNLRVAFMPWYGYNFEDAVILNQRLVKDDIFTSVHIYEKEATIRELKDGIEEITRDIPNIKEEDIDHLDERGIIKVGTYVKPGMMLVGKVTPKGDIKPTPEERLLRVIFGEKAGHVENKSLYAESSVEGTVIGVKVFTKKGYCKDQETKDYYDSEKVALDRTLYDKFLVLNREEMIKIVHLLSKDKLTGECKVGNVVYKKGDKLPLEDLKKINRFTINNIVNLFPKATRDSYEKLKKYFQDQKKRLKQEYDQKMHILDKDDILPSGVVKMVKVYIAARKKIKVGDKIAGRHGNKGIISSIVPEVDMPYLKNGDIVDIILNPLGVPSRMNIGQILEVHLGLAGKLLGNKLETIFNEQRENFVKKLRDYMVKIASISPVKDTKEEILSLSDEKIIEYARDWASGVKFASGAFDGLSELELKDLFKMAGIDSDGKCELYDGKTGEKIRERVNVGYMYFLKLHHLIDEKVHARSVGPYSLITQQPVGGKALFGGQRFGEMEVWSLEAYGAAHNLRELLTIKADDVDGRLSSYKAITRGENISQIGISETFFVLVSELKALGLDVNILKKIEEKE